MLNINTSTIKRSGLVLLLVGLAGCANHYPLGIPEEQWLLMSSEQQLEARSQQAALDQAAQARREAEARAREAEARRQTAELEQRRQGAAYGERVQCILEPVEVYLRGRWEPARPVAMDLVQGFPIELTATDTRGRYGQRLAAGFDGQVVRICSSIQALQRPYGESCVDLVATRQQLQRGISRSLEQERLLKGTLYCDLVLQALPGQRLKSR
ncbi:hypothetical protein [Nitrincola lacisaponensis]|uniref:hypothetical protein n=1 Tax=Nitrincola lacisaponensis TaxID=267850 RepID=UPI00068E17D6|nr:hypothetical protein [Nitrincola lacisaponensis]